VATKGTFSNYFGVFRPFLVLLTERAVNSIYIEPRTVLVPTFCTRDANGPSATSSTSRAFMTAVIVHKVHHGRTCRFSRNAWIVLRTGRDHAIV